MTPQRPRGNPARPPTPESTTFPWKDGVCGVTLALGDLCAVALSVPLGLFLGDALRRGLQVSATRDIFVDFLAFRLVSLLVVGFGLLGWFSIGRRHYVRRRSFWQEWGDIEGAVAVAALVDAALLYSGKVNFSRLVWAAGWLSVGVTLPLLRQGVKRGLSLLGIWRRPTLIIGTGDNAREAFAALGSEPLLGYDVKAFVRVEGEPREIEWPRPVCFSLEEGLSWTEKTRERWHLILALESHQLDLQSRLAYELSLKDHDLTVAPPLRGLPLYGLEATHFFSHEVLFLHVRNNLARPVSMMTKRMFDLVLAGLGLVFLSPGFLFLAWAIRRDGGPAFFFHRRVGRNGRAFHCLKFRSMRLEAERLLEEHLTQHPAAREEWRRQFKLSYDPRVTPLGRFLRRTSLDELPQLINVLKGDMSLVGPRPIVEEERSRYGALLPFYLEAKPGMTGLWQVSGRSDTHYAQRVMLDTWYAQNWSLWHDVVIVLKTIRTVLSRQGAV